MLLFDFAAFVNLLIGSVVSVAIGFAIAALYFKKATRAEKIVDQVKLGLQKAIVPALYPRFYDPQRSFTVEPKEPPQNNTDIPSVEYAIFSEKAVHLNQRTDVLIKIQDSGFDFDNPGGATVLDHRGNELRAVPLGLGFVLVTFQTVIDDSPGPHELTIELQDVGEHNNFNPHRNRQTLVFEITKEEKT